MGESWEMYGELEAVDGPFPGRTLDQLVAEFKSELLGTLGDASVSFPLLTKWLDCREWLSVQVHPDDNLAAELTGDPALRGKTEAWYVLHADPQSSLIHGLRPGVRVECLEEVQGEELLDYLGRLSPRVGDLLFTSAGTVHALGPGYMIYEIQQSSDLTYRLYDWGRDRETHPSESLRCVRESVACDFEQGPGRLSCPYFHLEVVSRSTTLTPGGRTFLIVTATDGEWTLSGEFGEARLRSGETLLLPAAMESVSASPKADGTLLSVGLGPHPGQGRPT